MSLLRKLRRTIPAVSMKLIMTRLDKSYTSMRQMGMILKPFAVRYSGKQGSLLPTKRSGALKSSELYIEAFARKEMTGKATSV